MTTLDETATATAAEAFVDTVRSVLFVHAHPDDETLWSGNLMSELADLGVQVTLVTTTRGELGQVVDASLALLAGTDALGTRREVEIAGALTELGVLDHVWLGFRPARALGRPDRRYRDSGMAWLAEGVAGPDPKAAADPESFTSAPLEEPVADLRAAVEARKPDALITYDAHGGYGHPDHVRAHEITVAVGTALGIPVYAIVGDTGRREAPQADMWFALDHQTERVRRALGHHRSQVTLTDDGRVRHDDGFTHDVPTGVGLTRIA